MVTSSQDAYTTWELGERVSSQAVSRFVGTCGVCIWVITGGDTRLGNILVLAYLGSVI